MRSFTDRKNRQWVLDITIGTAIRIKDLAGIDLLSDEQGGLLEMVGGGSLSAYATICDCLYAAVQPQAAELGVSDEQFGAELGAEQMTKAAEAFIGELIDFFLVLRPPLGETLKAVWQKTQASRSEEANIVRRALARPEVDEAVTQALRDAEAEITRTLGTLSGKSPASSASTPAG